MMAERVAPPRTLMELLAQLEEFRQGHVCSYGAGHFPEVRPCDCKYGGPGIGEQTGCPELRDIETGLLRILGYAEYDAPTLSELVLAEHKGTVTE
jgi:hypothetical protein